jgi:hypothetical protein
MKQKIYVLGLVTILIIFTGIILKVNHWAGASILLTTGFVILVLIFIPAALINNFKVEGSKQNQFLYIITFITCLVVFTAMLFKILHWPYAGLFLLVALPFPYVVFLPVFLYISSKRKNINIYNIVFVLFLLALNSVMSVLLALNVPKTIIDDSYNISRNYNKLENVLEQLPLMKSRTLVDRKIDEVLKIVDDYQDIILISEGVTMELWRDDPGNLVRPEAASVAGKALLKEGDSPVGARLETGLKSLINVMENTKGYEGFGKVAPEIFNIRMQTDGDYSFGGSNFIANNLVWSLIYLDGLKANLLMIKAAGATTF